MGSSHFARRYFENRFFFPFLRLLRCFSSPGSLPYTMDSCMGDGGLLRRVPPFRNLRIHGYLLLPAAYRSLSRLSSALSAKASTLRSSSFNLPFTPSVALLGVCLVRFSLPRSFFAFWLSRFCYNRLVFSDVLLSRCKLDNKICSIFGFQGTGGPLSVPTCSHMPWLKLYQPSDPKTLCPCL